MNIENKDCLLTIAIPTYNRKNMLKRALNSIVPQLSSKIEILVSDNASNDGTDAMISENFPMVYYIKNELNMGADYNFLQCFREAKGKYILLLGSDDRLVDGALNYLTDFLETNNCDLIFTNFRKFDSTKKEAFIKESEHIKSYAEKQDILTTDRNCYISYAGHSITFMSASIVRREFILKVENPERFIGTYFMHTYIIFDSVRLNDALFGVIMQPLIEANATAGESELSKTPEKDITVFGKCMYALLCEHAVKCGFKKTQMRKIYLQYLHNYPFWLRLLSYKHKKNVNSINNFWQDGYPVVKHFPSEWIKVMLVAITPRWVINVIYKIYKSFKKDK